MILAERLLLKWDQKGFGTEAGASQSVVSTWESGTAHPKGDQIPKVARLLNVEPRWLARKIAKEILEADPLESRLLIAFRRLSADKRESWVVSLEERVGKDLAAKKLEGN